MKYKILGVCAYLFVVGSAFGSEILVPLNDGKYQKVKEEYIISEVVEVEKEIIEEQIYQEQVTQKINYIPSEEVLFEDLLFLSVDYKNNSFDLKDIKNNKNLFKREIAESFIDESKIYSNVDEDMYLFSINTFGNNTKFKDKENIDLKNNGLIFGFQYGLTDEINTKLNIGYSHSKIEDSKSDNLFLLSDSRYFYDGDINYGFGMKLGYLNGKNTYYSTEDMFIGLVYSQIAIPVNDTMKISGELQSSFISNMVSLKFDKEVELENFNIGISLSSDYVFRYFDKDKKIYTHISNEKPTAKLEISLNNKNLAVNPFYEFVNKSAGVGIEYRF